MKIYLPIVIIVITSCDSENVLSNQKIKTEEKTDITLNEEINLIKIKAIALRSMMDLHADTKVDKYYVIEEKELLRYFEEFFPKVVINNNNRFGRVRGSFQELSTGNKAKKWTVGNIKIEGDNAEVDVRWDCAALAAGIYYVHLARKSTGWVLVSYESGPTS